MAGGAASEDRPTLVGIDHGLSFPLRYFEAHGLMPSTIFSTIGRPMTITLTWISCAKA